MQKNLFIIILLISMSGSAIGQTSLLSGAWTTGTNWVGGTAPNTGSIGANVIINNAMTLAAGSSLTGFGATTITINNGGKLTVPGNLDLTGSGISFIINTGGTLDVSGTLTENNASQITLQGGTVKAGTLNLPNNANSKFNYTSGTLTLTGSLFIGAGETYAYSPSIDIPGNVTINNGSAITATTLGGTISLSSSSKLTLNTGGSLTPASISLTSSELVLSSGTLNYTSALTINGSSKLTINGGTANLKGLTAGSAGTIAIASGATMIVTSLTTTANSDAVVNNVGTLTVNGDVNSNGVINNSGTMQVNGNLTQGNSGNTFTSSGILNVTGDATANGQIQLNPGAAGNSDMTVNGNFTVNANPWLIVGTNVSSCGTTVTKYADLVIKKNLILTGSGDVTINQNGRMAVFGKIDGTSSSGTLVTVNCGGQAYVDKGIDLGAGGGNTVTNSNGASSPTGTNGSPVIGLYVNGTTTAQTVTGTVGNKASLKANDLPFYNWIGSLSGSPLPVTLLSFRASVNSTGVLLAWATASEKNFDKFIVERSADGSSFESIGEVKGAGNSSTILNYSLQDDNALLGKSYYRLKSVDFDYSFEYSKPVYVEFEGTKTFVIYPNPSTGESIKFKVNFEPQSNDRIEVFSFLGSELVATLVKETNGEILFSTPLRPGNYIIRYTADSFQHVEKMLVK